MTIKIYGAGVPGSIGGSKPNRPVDGPRKGQFAGKSDRVDFSSALQQAGKAREAVAPVDAARVEKVQSLKAQVASGTYKPDSREVAGSLLRFLVEGKV